MSNTTLSPDGLLSVPETVRQQLPWKPGAQLAVSVDSRGRLIFEPEPTGILGNLPGLLHHLAPVHAPSVELMDQGIARLAKREFPPED